MGEERRRRKGSGRTAGLVGLLTALTITAAVVAPAASARDAAATGSASFAVAGSHGYSLNVKSEGGMVTVIASDARPPVDTISPGGALRPANTGDVSATTYFALGAHPGSTGIEARLGLLGEISVSFKPSGGVHVIDLGPGEEPGSCTSPRRIIRRLGTFSGTIRFRGENGYTTVDTTRARGSIGASPFHGCGSGPRARLSSVGAESDLRAMDNRNGIQFRATTTAAGVVYDAFWAEPIGVSLIVSRRARALAPLASFAVDPALHFAKLSPPAPFFGSAAYGSGEGRSATTWGGDLGVAFPGSTVPLTGPGFSASLGAGG